MGGKKQSQDKLFFSFSQSQVNDVISILNAKLYIYLLASMLALLYACFCFLAKLCTTAAAAEPPTGGITFFHYKTTLCGFSFSLC